MLGSQEGAKSLDDSIRFRCCNMSIAELYLVLFLQGQL